MKYEPKQNAEAFPSDRVVQTLIPPMDEIPEKFRQFPGQTRWHDLVSAWFFSGIEILEKKPKDGIDSDRAIRHVAAILRSWQPSHQHKEAACAYLLSLWFDDIKWKEQEKENVR